MWIFAVLLDFAQISKTGKQVLRAGDHKKIPFEIEFYQNIALQQMEFITEHILFAAEQTKQEDFSMSDHENYRNEIKAYIVRAGMTMSEVVEVLADEYGWSSSVPNLSGKLKRGSLRYGEAVELADVLGYDIVWQKRRK